MALFTQEVVAIIDRSGSMNGKEQDTIGGVNSSLEVIKQDLKVMDQTAITLAKDNKLPIIVFSIKSEYALIDVIFGNGQFTIIN